MTSDSGGRHVRSAFGDAKAFCAAMRAEGFRGFVVPSDGTFHAKLTQVALHGLNLSSIEETLPSISFIRVPGDTVLAAFALNDRTRQIWGGCRLAANDLVLVGPGQSIHRRSEGASHWGLIWVQTRDLRDYSRSLLGKAISIDSMDVWRLPAAVSRRLRALQKSLVGAAHARCMSLLHPQAVHGLEQQIIDLLMEALSGTRRENRAEAWARRQRLMALFEQLPRSGGQTSLARLCGALDLSEALLRRWCEETLGMDPTRYAQLRSSQGGTN